MAGVKGRSGRKTKLERFSIEEILGLSNRAVRQCLEDESIDLYRRGELGMRFICKYMPNRVEATLKVLQISDETIARLLNMMDQHNKPRKVIDTSDNVIIDGIEIEPKLISSKDLQDNNNT